MKMKYILISLQIKCGEYEFKSHTVHEITNQTNALLFSENYAKTFYEGKYSQYENDDWYYFNGGEVAVKFKKVEEITKREYEAFEFQLR
jgi:hypothetical protein